MYKKMIYVVLNLILINMLFCLQRPVIKTGISSNNSFNRMDLNNLKTEYISDNLYASVKENFFDIFSIIYKIETGYSNYIKLTDDIEKLKEIKLYNSLQFNLTLINFNHFMLITKPMLFFKSDIYNIKLYNKFSYEFKITDFKFKSYYSNDIQLLKDKQIYHNFNFSFYWNMPKQKFIKFKIGINSYLHHYLDEKKINPIKKVNFTFEMCFDFNNLDFDEIFDKIEENNYE
ncbi:MAG: hypothetical protein JXB50_03555 [Spirochaetes bacterium]|nr:hypothetical protein [Spirochaetota bacterium]